MFFKNNKRPKVVVMKSYFRTPKSFKISESLIKTKEDYKTNISITRVNALELVGAENEAHETKCLVPERWLI